MKPGSFFSTSDCCGDAGTKPVFGDAPIISLAAARAARDLRRPNLSCQLAQRNAARRRITDMPMPMYFNFEMLLFLAPALILAMAISAALGPSLINVVWAISLVWWPGFCRLTRGEVLQRISETYVEAARSIGVPTYRLLTRPPALFLLLLYRLRLWLLGRFQLWAVPVLEEAVMSPQLLEQRADLRPLRRVPACFLERPQNDR
jgi:hypothetical protein